jgi:hypothetical protein
MALIQWCRSGHTLPVEAVSTAWILPKEATEVASTVEPHRASLYFAFAPFRAPDFD